MNIAINSNNLFFLQSMRHIFMMYFRDKEICIMFNPVIETQSADLVVNSCSTLRPNEPIQLRITLRDRDSMGKCIYYQRTFSQYGKVEDFVLLLDNLFNSSVNGSSQKDTPNENIGIRITYRENEVLREILTGLPALWIAKKLQISVKTISSHKLSVMRKLGFKTSQELYIWLLADSTVANSDNKSR